MVGRGMELTVFLKDIRPEISPTYIGSGKPVVTAIYRSSLNDNKRCNIHYI